MWAVKQSKILVPILFFMSSAVALTAPPSAPASKNRLDELMAVVRSLYLDRDWTSFVEQDWNLVAKEIKKKNSERTKSIITNALGRLALSDLSQFVGRFSHRRLLNPREAAVILSFYRFIEERAVLFDPLDAGLFRDDARLVSQFTKMVAWPSVPVRNHDRAEPKPEFDRTAWNFVRETILEYDQKRSQKIDFYFMIAVLANSEMSNRTYTHLDGLHDWLIARVQELAHSSVENLRWARRILLVYLQNAQSEELLKQEGHGVKEASWKDDLPLKDYRSLAYFLVSINAMSEYELALFFGQGRLRVGQHFPKDSLQAQRVLDYFRQHPTLFACELGLAPKRPQ